RFSRDWSSDVCSSDLNGVGKSGYSRVLKKACRARDKREQVLPNANQASAVPRRAQATFHVTIDGSKTDLVWVDGEDPPEELSEKIGRASCRERVKLEV